MPSQSIQTARALDRQPIYLPLYIESMSYILTDLEFDHKAVQMGE